MKKDEIIKWIVGIALVIYMIFQLYVSFSFNSSMSEISDNLDDIVAPYKVYEQQENRIEEMLTDDGYEILYVGISNYSANPNLAQFPEKYGLTDEIVNPICSPSNESCWSKKIGASVNMKSLGNRNDQVWDTLITMYTVYPNAFTYGITIKSPTDTCVYTIFGGSAYNWFENSDLESYELIQYQIDNLVSCS